MENGVLYILALLFLNNMSWVCIWQWKLRILHYVSKGLKGIKDDIGK